MGYDKRENRGGKNDRREGRDRKRNGGATLGDVFGDQLSSVQTVPDTRPKENRPPRKPYEGKRTYSDRNDRGDVNGNRQETRPPRKYPEGSFAPRQLRGKEAETCLSKWWKLHREDRATGEKTHRMAFMRVCRAEVIEGPFCKWTVEFNRDWKTGGNDWVIMASGNCGVEANDLSIAKLCAQLAMTQLQDGIDAAELQAFKDARDAERAASPASDKQHTDVTVAKYATFTEKAVAELTLMGKLD